MHISWDILHCINRGNSEQYSYFFKTCLVWPIVYLSQFQGYSHFCHIMTSSHKNIFGVACPSWWRHQMETFSALLAICARISPVQVNCPHKGQSRGALMFSLICAWINDWVNSREAGDWRHHRGYYDVNVMFVRGINLSPMTWSLTFSLICASTKDCANHRDDGGLRHHGAHYAFTVMYLCIFKVWELLIRSCPMGLYR